MAQFQTVQLPVKGMDCANCTQTVQKAIAKLPGVRSVEVLLSSERATVTLDPAQIDIPAIRNAVSNAGYTIPIETTSEPAPASNPFTKRVLTLFGIVFAIVLFVVVFGEWLGLFGKLTDLVPWPIGIGIVIIAGFPIFRKVIQAALRRQIISHTLMTLGVLAALAIGQWATAAVIVLFMRVGEYAEHFTTEKARQSVKRLTNLAPQTARVERNGESLELPVDQIAIGEIVVIRPGEVIPVDGEVLSGHATINQATITGEAMPVDAGVGSSVFAATIATLGSLRVRTTRIGKETTFGRVITMVEEAEAHRADVQRIADKVSAYYLPVVAGIALLTFLIRRDPLATAAVLVVACSCSFALATPIAMLASIGAAAKRGLLIKGGKYIEILAKADVLLLDKTGTLTLGKPQVTDVVAFTGMSDNQILTLAASAERYSEHPLAEAVRQAAAERKLTIAEPENFTSLPGTGIQAQIKGQRIEVGSYRILGDEDAPPIARDLEGQGKTLLYVKIDGKPVGVLAASDTMRDDVPAALSAVKTQGMSRIELLTGDNERSASTLAAQLGISYRANLLPEDKIAIVKQYQSEGHTVVMIGDGVNDAPALAQANIGIAMGIAGTDVAIEAAHVALMSEDWSLIPDVFAIAKRTMGVVRFNIGFTIVYNIIGLTLAALGILPPILAAAAQSLPDLGILANSSRLLRYKQTNEPKQSFNFQRWAPFIVTGLIAVVIVSVVAYILVTINPAIDTNIKTAVEAITTITMLFGVPAAVIVYVTSRTEQIEGQYGSDIPVTDCSCCAPNETPVNQSSSTVVSVVSLDSIEIR